MSNHNDALLGAKIRKLCDGGQFDLTDSPKSMVDAVVRLCAETACTAETEYGCHIDLGPNETPDGCVFDEDRVGDCDVACRLSAEGKGKLDCEYWKPILVIKKEQVVS